MLPQPADAARHRLGLALETDVWLVLVPDGTVVGYAALHYQDHVMFQAEGYVAPALIMDGQAARAVEPDQCPIGMQLARLLPSPSGGRADHRK